MLEQGLTPPLVQLNQINVRIDERDILKNVDFSIHENEIVTLIGPNGAGKSTLIKVILGITKPSSGQIQNKKSLNQNGSAILLIVTAHCLVRVARVELTAS